MNASIDESCFITTACMVAKGLPDDCFELQFLREFRDGYVKSLPTGAAVLARYYEMAPKVIQAINRSSRAKQEYLYLYSELVLRSIELIQSGDRKAAFENYQQIFTQLEGKYLGA